MKQWWEIEIPDESGSVPLVRAVAYYRHSAQDRKETSIPIQRDQVRDWAAKNGVEIIHEFADAGKSERLCGYRHSRRMLTSAMSAATGDPKYSF